jgi:hypothetical protein
MILIMFWLSNLSPLISLVTILIYPSGEMCPSSLFDVHHFVLLTAVVTVHIPGENPC